MAKIEIDLILSDIDPRNFVRHESGRVHLKFTANPDTRGKNSHIIFIDNKFQGFANIVNETEVNNCIVLPPDATIENLPF